MIDRKIGDKPINFEVTIGIAITYSLSHHPISSDFLSVSSQASFL